MRLYEAIVLSTLLYSEEVWPLTATLTKRLNAAQPITDDKGASWVSPDRVTNEEVRVRTGQHSMGDTLSERRLRWLRHVIRMDHQRIPRQALHWEVTGFKVHVVRVQTGGAPLARTCQGWESPGGSRGGSSKQIRMASKCGPMHPLGRGLNQGQGEVFIKSAINYI